MHGEAFSAGYELPNDLVYAETCASAAMIFFARRMLEAEPKAEYADILEKELYNGLLSGMQLDGRRFFYVNPLEVVPGVSGCLPEYRHVLPVRPQLRNGLRLLPAQRGAHAHPRWGSTPGAKTRTPCTRTCSWAAACAAKTARSWPAGPPTPGTGR